MKGQKHTEEQIAFALKQSESDLNPENLAT